MIAHALIEINDSTPTQVTPAGVESSTSITLQIQNLGTSNVYIGAAGLTSSSYGALVAPKATLSIDSLYPGDEVFALSASGTGSVAVLRVNR